MPIKSTAPGTEVTLDGSDSTDPDSTPGTNDDIIGFDWYEGDIYLGTGEIISCTFPLGTHNVTLVVTDSFGVTDDDRVVITVQDTTPPIVDAGPDIELEQETWQGTEVTLQGWALDNCDDQFEYEWSDDGVILGKSAALTHTFKLGTNILMLKATDDSGNVGEDTVIIEIVDTSPPSINSVSANPDVLWPPNHKMVEVMVTVDAEDICDPSPVCWVVGVTCNEPVNGPGAGNTEADWEYTDDPLVVLLRAESAGTGTGRIYTICVECVDASERIATAAVEVTVPHDQGEGKKKGKK